MATSHAFLIVALPLKFTAIIAHVIMRIIIQEIEKIIQDYYPALRQLSEADFTFKPSPEKWSGKEYLGHLIDSAQNNIRRFVVAQQEEQPYIVYEKENWAAAANYQNYPLKDLVDFWVLINKHIVNLLKNMPKTAYENEVLTQAIHTVKCLAEQIITTTCCTTCTGFYKMSL